MPLDNGRSVDGHCRTLRCKPRVTALGRVDSTEVDRFTQNGLLGRHLLVRLGGTIFVGTWQPVKEPWARQSEGAKQPALSDERLGNAGRRARGLIGVGPHRDLYFDSFLELNCRIPRSRNASQVWRRVVNDNLEHLRVVCLSIRGASDPPSRARYWRSRRSPTERSNPASAAAKLRL
jgi:hypothetical protein